MNNLISSVLAMGIGLFMILFGAYKAFISYEKSKKPKNAIKMPNSKTETLDDHTTAIFDNIEEKN